MVDFNKLLPMAIVLISLAAIVLGGIAVVEQYRTTLKESAVIANESVTTVSGTATLANDDVTVINYVVNATNNVVFIDANTTDNPYFNFTVGGVITSGFSDAEMNITYTYDADTDGSDSATTFITGLSIFGAFVGVLAISVIGKVIVGLFKKT